MSGVQGELLGEFGEFQPELFDSQRCQWDTGSMYGCDPACSSAAVATFEYRNGSYPAFRVALCARHESPMAGRVYPSPLVRVSA